jgi:hypothetical protein
LGSLRWKTIFCPVRSAILAYNIKRPITVAGVTSTLKAITG